MRTSNFVKSYIIIFFQIATQNLKLSRGEKIMKIIQTSLGRPDFNALINSWV